MLDWKGPDERPRSSGEREGRTNLQGRKGCGETVRQDSRVVANRPTDTSKDRKDGGGVGPCSKWFRYKETSDETGRKTPMTYRVSGHLLFLLIRH